MNGYRSILVRGIALGEGVVTADLLWPPRAGTDAAALRIPHYALHPDTLATLHCAKPKDIVLLLVDEGWVKANLKGVRS